MAIARYTSILERSDRRKDRVEISAECLVEAVAGASGSAVKERG